MKRQKQNYLKENIINKKWDPNKFSEFMRSQKHDGTNIDNWTFEELIQQVNIFKNMQQIQSTNLVKSEVIAPNSNFKKPREEEPKSP